jgi:1,3-alpha-isomaltosidase
MYVPQGEWVDVWTGTPVSGGEWHDIDAGEAKIPVLCRAAAWPEVAVVFAS